jgi:sialic acid synthase SpsE
MTKPYFIAEISANHAGSLKTAKKLIKVAKYYGADAVKLQTYNADSMTINSNKKKFLVSSGLWKGEKLWDLYDRAKTPYSWHKDLFDYAKKLKITCFSTPFDSEAVD